MFRNAKVGDRAYDFLRGWGTIVAIEQDSEYPICFNADIDSFCTFTFEGKRTNIDISPSLFWDEVRFEAPEKPLMEFVEDKQNGTLIFRVSDTILTTREGTDLFLQELLKSPFGDLIKQALAIIEKRYKENKEEVDSQNIEE